MAGVFVFVGKGKIIQAGAAQATTSGAVVQATTGEVTVQATTTGETTEAT